MSLFLLLLELEPEVGLQVMKAWEALIMQHKWEDLPAFALGTISVLHVCMYLVSWSGQTHHTCCA